MAFIGQFCSIVEVIILSWMFTLCLVVICVFTLCLVVICAQKVVGLIDQQWLMSLLVNVWIDVLSNISSV